MRGFPSTSIARGSRLRDLVATRVAALIERVRHAPWPAPLQRWSGEGWHVIAARWPSFAELVASRLGVAGQNGAPILPKGAAPAEAARAPEQAATPMSQSMRGPARAPAPATETLISELRGAKGWEARRDAALRLASSVTESTIDALIEAVRDPSVEVAVAAVTALAGRHRPRVIRALTDILTEHGGYFGPATRAAAVAALARSASEAELAPVLAAVRAVDAEVSIAAILAIGERLKSAAAEPLLPVLRDDAGFFLPIVRQAAASVLARSGALTPELTTELLAREQDPHVRAALRP